MLREAPNFFADPVGLEGHIRLHPTLVVLDLEAVVARFEANLLSQALSATRYNQCDAVLSLGFTYHQYRSRLKKYGIARSWTLPICGVQLPPGRCRIMPKLK